MFKKLALSAVSLVMTLGLTGCIGLQSPEISFKSSEFKLVSFQDVNTKLNFSMFNPNMIPLKGVIDYSLKINDQELWNGTSSPIDTGSQKSESFTLESTVNIPKAFGTLSAMIKELGSGATSLPIEIAGTYKSTIAGINIEAPLKAQANLPLPKLPQFSLQNISLEKFDLRNPTFKIRARINNANSVPLNLDKFVYSLTDRSKQIVQATSEKSVSIPAQSFSDLTWSVKVDLSKVDMATIQRIVNDPTALNFTNTLEKIN